MIIEVILSSHIVERVFYLETAKGISETYLLDKIILLRIIGNMVRKRIHKR